MDVRIGLAINWKGGKVTESRRDAWHKLGIKYLGG